MDNTGNKQKRILAFIFGCMVARIAIVYLAYKYHKTLNRELAVFASALSLGFLTIYMLGLRKTGPEVLGDVIWWDHLRPVHAILWGAFAVAIARKHANAYLILAVDTAIGFAAFMNFHKS